MRRHWLGLWLWYAVVFLTGAAVMMLEILGTRVLAPFYGTSLIVWAALMSVTLLALAALTTALIPILARPLLRFTDPLGLRLGALVCAFGLFAAPLTLLAMTGPWVIHWSCVRGGRAGVVSGTVYALSTLGSVVGTLGLSFYLLPALGSRAILAWVSAVLAGLAVLVALRENQRLAWWIGIATASIVAASWAVDFTHVQRLFVRESLYGRIAVVDDSSYRARWLLADASIIGGLDLNRRHSLLAYQELVEQALSVHPQAKTVLLIGLGAGTLVERFTRRGLKVDVIEIDPAVAEAARRYFGFHPPGEFWIADARTQVRQIPHRYDLIVHDCFTGGSEPTHLLTREAWLDVRARLHPGGVVMVNFVGFREGSGRKALDAVWYTLASVFSQVVVLAAEPSANFTGFLLLAADRQLSLEALARYQLDDLKLALTLTDDYNPLEYLQLAKVKAYRQALFSQVGKGLFLD